MSAAEETIQPASVAKTGRMSAVDRVVAFFSSVRFGVSLLVTLVALSMIGMLIVQQNVDGFDSYFASLTPAEKIVFGSLGFFDIYHSWYYNGLLLILSLNIVLASIDRFPSAWAYITKPKLKATTDFLLKQPASASFTISEDNETQVIERINRAFTVAGMKPVVSESRTIEYGTDEAGNKDFS